MNEGFTFDEETSRRIVKATRRVEDNPDVLDPFYPSGNMSPRPSSTRLPIHVFLTSGNLDFAYRMVETEFAWYRFIIDDFTSYGPFNPNLGITTAGSYELHSLQFVMQQNREEWFTIPQREAGDSAETYYQRWAEAFVEYLKTFEQYEEQSFRFQRNGGMIQFTFGGSFSAGISSDRPASPAFIDRARFQPRQVSSTSNREYFGPPSNALYINPFSLTYTRFFVDVDNPQSAIPIVILDSQIYMTWEWSLFYTEAIAFPTDTDKYIITSIGRRNYPALGLRPTYSF